MSNDVQLGKDEVLRAAKENDVKFVSLWFTDVLGFLTDVASSEGGFQANTRIPFADGLSTFTGLLTAQDLGRSDLIPAGRIEEFVSGALECKEGGFMGASWDQQPDVEYTFYGLGILGLLHAER